MDNHIITAIDWACALSDEALRRVATSKLSKLGPANHEDPPPRQGLRRTNTSGHKGVSRHSQQPAWQVQVWAHGKRTSKLFSDSKHGGREAALAAAVEWVRTTREKLHGDFARHQ